MTTNSHAGCLDVHSYYMVLPYHEWTRCSRITEENTSSRWDSGTCLTAGGRKRLQQDSIDYSLKECAFFILEGLSIFLW